MSCSLDLKFNNENENGRNIFSLTKSYRSIPIGIIELKTEEGVTVYTISIFDYITDWLSRVDHRIDMSHDEVHEEELREKIRNKKGWFIYPFRLNSQKIQTVSLPIVTIQFKNEIDLINFKLRWG